MLSEKRILLIVSLQYFFIVVYHIIYSFKYCTINQTEKIAVWFVCVSIIYLILILLFRKNTNLLIIYILLSVIATTTYFGYILNTLSWAIIIFFSGSLIISIIANFKFVLIWSIASTLMLVSYALIWPEILLKTVPSLFMYLGYIFTYVFGICNELLLVSEAEKYRVVTSKREKILKEENNLKSIFWANISNEIKSPINVINGMSRLLKGENLNSRALDYTDNIEKASSMLLNIVSDTLELTEIESNVYDVQEVPYDIYKIISDTVIDVSQYLTENLNVTYCIANNVPTVMVGDAELIKKVMSRIVKNSLSLVREGEVHIDVSAKKEPSPSDLVKLSIAVSDTGGGLSDESLKTIFNGFENINSKKNVLQETIGLSLKVCKTMIERIGGNINVDSTLGVGTTFMINFMQKTGSVDYLDNEDIESESVFIYPNAHVLVVDDSPTNIKLISSKLKKHEINPDNASSGMEAFQMMINNHYDLVFVDYQMPGMNGVELLKRIKAGIKTEFDNSENNENEMNSNTKVIVMVSQSNPNERNRYINLGFDDYITKPIEENELSDILLRYLSF